MGLALVIGVLSLSPVVNLLSARQAMNASFEPFDLVNTYGAFGSVSRERYELIIEGTSATSLDEHTRWKEYELPCKPGRVDRRPCWVTPYHYRLDWQLWFALSPDSSAHGSSRYQQAASVRPSRSVAVAKSFPDRHRLRSRVVLSLSFAPPRAV